jgi:hypothetical protein
MDTRFCWTLRIAPLVCTVSAPARLIEELDERPDPESRGANDERRRYYRLTNLGRSVASLEARRLERLLRDARSSGLLPKRT